MTLSSSYNRPRILSCSTNNNTNSTGHEVSSDEITKTGEGLKCVSGQGNITKEIFLEGSTCAKAEGARPKTPGGIRRPNKLKQGKTLSTSMEIWQIQKELKRGEMVQVRI